MAGGCSPPHPMSRIPFMSCVHFIYLKKGTFPQTNYVGNMYLPNIKHHRVLLSLSPFRIISFSGVQDLFASWPGSFCWSWWFSWWYVSLTVTMVVVGVAVVVMVKMTWKWGLRPGLVNLSPIHTIANQPTPAPTYTTQNNEIQDPSVRISEFWGK